MRLPHLLREPVVAHALDGRVLEAEHVAQRPALAVVQAGDGDQAVLRLVDAVVVVPPARRDVLRPQLRRLLVASAPSFRRSRSSARKPVAHRLVQLLDRQQRAVLRRQSRGEQARLDPLPLARSPSARYSAVTIANAMNMPVVRSATASVVM